MIRIPIWVLVAGIAVQAIAHVALIGEPRDPITNGHAVADVIIAFVASALLIASREREDDSR